MCYYVDDDYSRNYYIQDYQGPRSTKEGLIILREKTNLQVRGNRMTVSSDDWDGIVSEYTVSVTDNKRADKTMDALGSFYKGMVQTNYELCWYL